MATAPLAWPQERPDPLRAFHIYIGGFNVFDRDYVASLTWCGLWAGILAGAVLLGPFLYALYRVARWLLVRHAIIELTPGRHEPTGHLRTKVVTCVCVIVFVMGGAAAIWISGDYTQAALDGALHAGLDWIADILAQAQGVQMTLNDVREQLPGVDSFYDPVASTVDRLASLSRAVGKVSDRLFDYWAMAKMAATLVGAGFIFLGQLAMTAAVLSSRRFAGVVAALLWLLLLLAWLVCGATYIATLATQDACIALDRLVTPGSAVQVQRLTRCIDQGDNVTSPAWGVAHVAAASLNRQLYLYSSQGTGAGQQHLTALTYKCNPAAPRTSAGTYTAAIIPCPDQYAIIEAPEAPFAKLLHTVPAYTPFAAAYADYRCAIDDANGCLGAGTIPRNVFDAIAAHDDAARQLVATMPALEKLTRCAAVDALLVELAVTHCPRMRFATRLLFGGFLAACAGFTAAFFVMLYGAQHFNATDAPCCLGRRARNQDAMWSEQPDVEAPRGNIIGLPPMTMLTPLRHSTSLPSPARGVLTPAQSVGAASPGPLPLFTPSPSRAEALLALSEEKPGTRIPNILSSDEKPPRVLELSSEEKPHKKKKSKKPKRQSNDAIQPIDGADEGPEENV